VLPIAMLWGQTPPADVNTVEQSANFNARTNLVVVRVVVSDKQGKAIDTLHKEDFRVLDRGKLQTITNFSVETASAATAQAGSTASSKIQDSGTQRISAEQANVVRPDRYIAYLFDDIHIKNDDLMSVRQAALRHIDTLDAATRIALFSTSGRNAQDFTDDHQVVKSAMLKLTSHSITVREQNACPDISYYLADLIANKQLQDAINMEVTEYMICNPVPGGGSAAQNQAASIVQSMARSILSQGEYETRVTLDTLNKIVRRMAAVPGQRTVVLVSPGFLIRDERSALLDAIEKAIRTNVVISSLDARGLFTLIPGGDASHSGNVLPAGYAARKTSYEAADASENADVLGELADSTGGSFFHNNNDFAAGFNRAASRPEAVYVLGFSPKDLKNDGAYHNLKVSVPDLKGLNLQARRGYYAPRRSANADEEAKHEIEDALFSPEEIRSIPILLRTQFFKTDDVNAKLSVLARVDVRGLRFRKVDGRNQDELTIVSGLFDRNGNYISAAQKLVQMHLRDDSLPRLLASGLIIKTNFDVKAGDYLVRLVVRDSEGQMLSAVSGAVQIP
jgi:VWFA-related protein